MVSPAAFAARLRRRCAARSHSLMDLRRRSRGTPFCPFSFACRRLFCRRLFRFALSAAQETFDPAQLLRRALGDLVHGAAARDRQRQLFENVLVACASRGLVLRLDQQPVIALLAGPAVHAHQMPAALKLSALEPEFQTAFLQAALRILFGLPLAAVPQHDGAAAVLAFRDRAFEFVVFDRVVFDLDGEPLLARHQGRTARHRPALHHAVELEAQVVVQPRRRVLLDDESRAFAPRGLAARLFSDVETALFPISRQRHPARPSLSWRGALSCGRRDACAHATWRRCGGWPVRGARPRPWRYASTRPSD